MPLCQRVQSFWDRHGTKLIGIGATAIGLLEFIDQATIQLIASLFGPKYGPYVGKIILIGAGVMVARRGFSNTRRHDDDHP